MSYFCLSLIINYIQQGHRKADIHWAAQEIHSLSCNPWVHCREYESTALLLILSNMITIPSPEDPF
jgi:hypothetical protein